MYKCLKKQKGKLPKFIFTSTWKCDETLLCHQNFIILEFITTKFAFLWFYLLYIEDVVLVFVMIPRVDCMLHSVYMFDNLFVPVKSLYQNLEQIFKICIMKIYYSLSSLQVSFINFDHQKIILGSIFLLIIFWHDEISFALLRICFDIMKIHISSNNLLFHVSVKFIPGYDILYFSLEEMRQNYQYTILYQCEWFNNKK